MENREREREGDGIAFNLASRRATMPVDRQRVVLLALESASWLGQQPIVVRILLWQELWHKNNRSIEKGGSKTEVLVFLPNPSKERDDVLDDQGTKSRHLAIGEDPRRPQPRRVVGLPWILRFCAYELRFSAFLIISF